MKIGKGMQLDDRETVTRSFFRDEALVATNRFLTPIKVLIAIVRYASRHLRA